MIRKKTQRLSFAQLQVKSCNNTAHWLHKVNDIEENRKRNKEISKIRAQLERPFAIIKSKWEHARARYIGIFRNEVHLLQISVAYNLRRAYSLATDKGFHRVVRLLAEIDGSSLRYDTKACTRCSNSWQKFSGDRSMLSLYGLKLVIVV